jgi:hypothetical protein
MAFEPLLLLACGVASESLRASHGAPGRGAATSSSSAPTHPRTSASGRSPA